MLVLFRVHLSIAKNFSLWLSSFKSAVWASERKLITWAAIQRKRLVRPQSGTLINKANLSKIPRIPLYPTDMLKTSSNGMPAGSYNTGNVILRDNRLPVRSISPHSASTVSPYSPLCRPLHWLFHFVRVDHSRTGLSSNLDCGLGCFWGIWDDTDVKCFLTFEPWWLPVVKVLLALILQQLTKLMIFWEIIHKVFTDVF